MGRYTKFHSNYILRKKHQETSKGAVFERDFVTIGGQHQIEKGKKPYYTDTNFLFTDNSYPSYKKKHNFGKWVAHWNYDDVKESSEDVNVVRVNNTSNDIRDFAYYGSAVELVKSSITNIINWFPAFVTFSSEEIYVPTVDGEYETLQGYHKLSNPFDVDFIHTLSEKEKATHNVLRFLMESYNDYTINGKDIKEYTLINRRFIAKTESKDRHVKQKETDFVIDKTNQEIDLTISPLSLKKYDTIELIKTNKLTIPQFNYSKDNITTNVLIDYYNRNNGSIRVDTADYTHNDTDSFLKQLSQTCNVKLEVTGYGFSYSNGTTSYNGTDLSFTKNSGSQTLSVNFRRGYTYTIGSSEFTAQTSSQTVKYVSNNGSRQLEITESGTTSTFDVSSYLSSYDDKAVNTSVSFQISGTNGTQTHNLTIGGLNVNNSISMGSAALSGTYNFIVKGTNNKDYIGTDTDLSFTSRQIYFNQSSGKVVTDNNIEIYNISQYVTSGTSFTFSILRKTNVTVNSTFRINPAFSLSLTNGDYFVEIDGDRNSYNWCTICYQTGDESKQKALSSVNRVRYYHDKLDVYKSGSDVALWSISVSNKPLEHVCFYRVIHSVPEYSFMQCVTDDELPDFITAGWEEVDCRPSTWLPTLDMSNGWDEYVKDGCNCGDKRCDDNGCYVGVLISRLSELKEDGDYKNFPLYTVYIDDVDGKQYKIEAYIISGETVLISKDEKLAIRCKDYVFDEFFESLDGFERQLLTLDSKPVYKNTFLTPLEVELGYKYVYRDYTWPSIVYDDEDDTIKYRFIDITSQTYIDYVSKLIDVATILDELWCDNIYKNMTHESIKNFDWTYTREYNEGEEQDNIDGGNQIMKLLRVYGRMFDDVKRHADGIGFVSNNTYDGFNNQPDAEISDRLDTMGWEITSSIPTFDDKDQGYINEKTGSIISKDVYDSLEDTTGYEPAYINKVTSEIIGETSYNGLITTKPELYDSFSIYRPTMDLSDVHITQSFINSITKQAGSNHEKWFNSANFEEIDTAKSDIEFVRRLLLSTSRIFNTKGTIQSIDMVMGLFGFGDDDYSVTEMYYFTEPKKVTEQNKLIEKVEEINFYKDYPKEYDDIYSGIPIKDVMIGKGQYLVPFYDQSRRYDGDFIFESRGGWARDGEDGNWSETLSYLHVVDSFGSLLDLDPSSLNDGDIYYVNDLASYTEYVNTLPEDLSHFFVLNREISEEVDGETVVTQPGGKYNPQLPESWSNVNMYDIDNPDTKNALYLDKIISVNVGNNPHVGYGTYDGGDEFREYMENPFKYSLDEYLLPAEWIDEAKNITYTLEEKSVLWEVPTNPIYNSGEEEKDSKIKINYPPENAETIPPYYINKKYFIIENGVKSLLYNKYFTDVIAKYLMQVIPSTTILILKGFDYYNTVENEIAEYGEIFASLSYNDVPSTGGTAVPKVSYYQEATTLEGKKIKVKPNAVFSGTVQVTGAELNASNGYISNITKNTGQTERPVASVTLTVTSKDDPSKNKVVTAIVKQTARTIEGYGDITIKSGLDNGKLKYNGKINAAGTNSVCHDKVVYSQTIYYSDNTQEDKDYEIVCGQLYDFTTYSGSHVANTGSVNGDNVPNGGEREKEFTSVTLTISLNGKEFTTTPVTIMQEAKTITGYADLSITSFTYPTYINADGTGSSSPQLAYEYYIVYSDNTRERIKVPPSTPPTGTIVSYTDTKGKVNVNNGTVTGPFEANKLHEPVPCDTVTVRVNLGDLTDEKTANVMQAASEIYNYTVHWLSGYD